MMPDVEVSEIFLKTFIMRDTFLLVIFLQISATHLPSNHLQVLY